jgi:hypothetical protein
MEHSMEIDLSYINHQVACAAQEIMVTAAERRLPHVLMRPRFYPDGSKWCALYGENVQDGVAGFGDTPALAAADFDKNWMNQRLPRGVKTDGGGDGN